VLVLLLLQHLKGLQACCSHTVLLTCAEWTWHKFRLPTHPAAAGVLIPKVFNIFTVAVKFASCVLCVSSGLPVGPEGPMIHMGAAIGAALSQGHSTTLGFTTNIFRRFRNPRDKRDFVTAGVAVGVATAFNAPIGGLLFAFEEVASFWKHSLGWQVRLKGGGGGQVSTGRGWCAGGGVALRGHSGQHSSTYLDKFSSHCDQPSIKGCGTLVVLSRAAVAM